MKHQIIQAVDIGTTKIAAIVAKKSANNKVEILGIGSAPSYGVRRADVQNILKTVEAIKTAVAEAELQSGISFKEVYVGVAGSHVKALQHRGILMRSNYHDIIDQRDLDKLKEDMYKLALPPGDTIVEVLAQEYIVDGEPGVIDPIGMPGSRIEGNFHVITGSSIAISNIKRCIEEAGLKVKDVIMQPLASAAAVLTEEEKQAGVALVDIGGGTTDVAIFIEGVIGHTAVIPFGGEIVTEDIKKGCNIMKGTAERLKIKHGSAIAEQSCINEVITIQGIESRTSKEISMMNLAHIIQARMEDILGFVSNEIGVSGLQNRLLGGLVLTGGGSKLKHIRQLTEYMTGLETRIGHPDQNLAPTDVKDVNNQIYATGIGLIIKGMERMKYEHPTAEKVDNIVEKPTIVENNLQPTQANEVVLEVKPIGKDDKVTTPSQEADDKSEMEKSQPRKNIMSALTKIKERIIDFMGEDLADFSDTKKDSQTKK